MKKYNLLDRLTEQYDFHNRLFENVIKGIKHKDAKIRINGNTNHMIWIAGNLASTRYDLAHKLGVNIENKYVEFMKIIKLFRRK